MEWLVILPMAIWVWAQGQRADALARRVAELERLIAGATAPARETQAPSAAAPMRTPMGEEEPLLLDTPLPEASNDDAPMEAPTPAAPAAPVQEEAVLLLTEVVPPDVADDPPTPFPPAAATPPPRVRIRDRQFEQWLAENGLAWLGGGALAFAAIALVSFAAQQAWFTPPVQIGCAVALGLVLLGASEWARRAARRSPPGNPLVAAMLAGAGVVTFYAATWGAHGLYDLLGWGTAAALLTLCAALLIGLSLLHGQALGVLAIVMALFAPALTHLPLWSPSGVTLYVCAVAAAGFSLAAFRRWAWVGVATLIGLYFWFASAIALDEIRRALALASFAALGGAALAFRQPLAGEAPGQLTWTRAHSYLPAVAICFSSVLLLWTWIAIAPLPAGLIAGPAWVSAILVALAAASVRARVAAPAAVIVAIAALVFGFVLYLRARFYVPSLGADFYPFVLFASVVVVASALGAQPHRTARAMVAASGAIGAALLTAVSAFSREEWHHYSAWGPLFTGGAILFAAAWFASLETMEPRKDKAVGFWTAAGAALVLLGVESAFPASVRTAAHAGAAALFACGFAWLGWGMLRHAAVAAAVFAIGHALSPGLIGAALAGAIPLPGALTILAASAGLLFGASYVAARREPRGWASEALSSASLIVVLIGVFLLLRWIAAGGAGAPVDGFTEQSLRVVALLAAGHAVLPRASQELGRIGAWRGHALMGAGLVYTLFAPTLSTNPWWGIEPAGVFGPPLLDTLLLAFLAPAALAFAASHRLYTRQRLAARIYAGAGGFLTLVWALLATRRGFHGGDMGGAIVGLFESACYALVFLAAALAIAFTARVRAARDAERPFTHDLIVISRGCAWFGLIVAGYILLVARHPWWGGQDPTTTNALSTLLAVLAQLVAVVLTLFLGRALSRSPKVEATRFAAASAAILFAWSFGHSVVRWLAHAGYMDNGPALAGLEGLAHGIWPLAFVLGAAFVTARVPNRETIRPYAFDMQAIYAAAIWPALIFAAFALWLTVNPWWGVMPAQSTGVADDLIALAAYGVAAFMSAAAMGVPHLRWRRSFAYASLITTTGHLFVAATLIVRRLYHPTDLGAAPVMDVEAWSYSAAWAVFGAVVFWLGTRRNDVMQRWIALTILVGATLYAFTIAFTRLTGLVQIGSLIGLAAVLLLVAWLARVYRTKPPAPTDLITITSSGRRDRRHVRR